MTTNQPTPVILSDADLAQLEAQPSRLINGLEGILLSPAERDALCQTVRALREVNQGIVAGIQDGKQLLHDQIATLTTENTALREQLAEAQRELETARLGRQPAWTCALCGQFCANHDELKKHECGMPYRVVRYGDGYEASMWVRSGAGGHFWTPLLATGYWAEPESFSTGVVNGLHLLDTHEEAQRAIERARLLNNEERILSIANPRSNPKT